MNVVHIFVVFAFSILGYTYIEITKKISLRSQMYIYLIIAVLVLYISIMFYNAITVSCKFRNKVMLLRNTSSFLPSRFYIFTKFLGIKSVNVNNFKYLRIILTYFFFCFQNNDTHKNQKRCRTTQTTAA